MIYLIRKGWSILTATYRHFHSIDLLLVRLSKPAEYGPIDRILGKLTSSCDRTTYL